MDSDRNPSAEILDGEGIVGVDDDFDAGRVPCEMLID